MSEIFEIVELLEDTNAAVSHLNAVIAENPKDDILRINARSIAKRQRDLEQKLDYLLRVKQAELVRYRVSRGWSESYPVKAITSSVDAFQELVTAVFDALRSGPKRRYRPTHESVALTSFELAGMGMGSVVISLSVPNDRLLIGETDFDTTLQIVESILLARERKEIRDLAERIGVAAVTKAYAWADASVGNGLDTQIRWGKSYADLREIVISLEDATIVKEIIETESEVENTPETVEGLLLGFDGATSYFHLETFGDRRDIRGSLVDGMPITWTTNRPYRAILLRTTRIRYATGEEKITWTLFALEPLHEVPSPAEQTT